MLWVWLKIGDAQKLPKMKREHFPGQTTGFSGTLWLNGMADLRAVGLAEGSRASRGYGTSIVHPIFFAG